MSAWTGRIFAYEPGTHQLLSQQAAQQSALGEKDGVLSDFGLKGLTDKTQEFSDPQDGQWIYLGPNNTGRYNAPASANILDLIKAGAALEDEFPRSLFHFYDPVPGHSDPLNINGVPMLYSAPNWALADSLLPVAGQSYSLKDARDHFYKALTSTGKSDRESAFGGLFLTLGHVIHLLQDVAQPQHVRNDMHCDADICKQADLVLQGQSDKILPLYNPSRYEAVTYDNANVAAYGGYTPVSMPLARDYWASLDNKGLAQFTNGNFVSAGTNFRLARNGDVFPDQNYAFPVPASISGSESIGEVYTDLGKAVPGNIEEYCASLQNDCGVQFVATGVFDSYLRTAETNTKASSYSVFSQDLELFGSQKLFALNALNFQEDWKFLLPRAIAYSAGLIDYFFRGRLDVQPDPNTPDGYLVFNKSSYPMTNGTLTLYYDDADGNRYPVPDASWSNVSMGPAGDNDADGYPIQFSAPTDPALAASGEYMLVFQGKIGLEDGVAGKLISVKNEYVYLAANTSSFCLWYNNCYGLINSYNNDFTLHATAIRPNEIFALAVYDGAEYTLESNYNDVNARCTYTVMRSGIEFARSPACLNSTPGSIAILDWTIGVNSKYVYLVKSVYSMDAQGYYHYLEEDADTYDHAGNYVSTIHNLPVQAAYSISANNTRICLTGYIDGFVTTAAMLTELSGNPVVTLAEDPGAGIYGGNSYFCALTTDRAYVLVYPLEGVYTLNVYDLNGNKIASLDVSETQQPGTYLTFWGVVATNTKIYIPVIIEYLNNPNGVITFTYKVIVHDRVITKNAAGAITSENFVREPDVTLPGLHINWGAYPAVDMKNVLGGPRQ